ncbi:MAG: hypothetical protein HLUCCA05_12700 [Roseibaca calidilacus]|nr:MAG: hypothetical protein HLUCCA05_12700 [Roseibaca calidilacus]
MQAATQMRIDLRQAQNTVTVADYLQNGGVLIGGSILADRPSRIVEHLRNHHEKVGASSDNKIWHMTVSLAPGQFLSQEKWKTAIREIGRRIGAPLHVLPYLIYRHVNAAHDHAHILFSSWTYFRHKITPVLPRDVFTLGNRIANRVGLPQPFDDTSGGPVKILAPIRSGKSDDIRTMAAAQAGAAVNDVMAQDKPHGLDRLKAGLKSRDVVATLRKHDKGPDGMAFTLSIPTPGMAKLHKRKVSISGGRIGSQFTLRGLERRIVMLRYLSDLPALLMLRHLFPNNAEQIMQEIERKKDDDHTRKPSGGGSHRGPVAIGGSIEGNSRQSGPDLSGTEQGSERRRRIDDEAVRTVGRHPDTRNGHPSVYQEPLENAPAAGRPGLEARADGNPASPASDGDGRLRLIDVIARLGDIETLTKERTQLRLMPGGGFQVEMMSIPAVVFDGHKARPASPEFAGIAKGLAKGIGLPTAQEYIELEADQMDSEGPPATDGPDF